MPGWNDPLLPQSVIQPLQQRLEQPTTTRSPMAARVRGFASGALEGLRGLTTPSSLASIAMTALPFGAGARAAEAAPAAYQDLTRIVPQLVDAAPGIAQALPTAEDVGGLAGALKYSLAKIPNAKGALGGLTQAAPKVAGELSPEFTAVGEEGAYNALRPKVNAPSIPTESSYQNILAQRGRAQLPPLQAPAPRPPAPSFSNPPPVEQGMGGPYGTGGVGLGAGPLPTELLRQYGMIK